MVRHEYPFSSTHVHRRRKYGWAIERGARLTTLIHDAVESDRNRHVEPDPDTE